MNTNLVHPMKYHLRFLLLLLAAFSVPVFAAGDSPQKRCDNVYKLSDAFNAIEPGVLIPAAGEIPEHCRVRGVIDGTIRFELSMPIEGWQGRFLFMAPGGLAGVIGDTPISNIRGSLYDTAGDVVGETNPVLIEELPVKAHVWCNRNQLSDLIGDTWNGTESPKIDNADSNLRLLNLNFINSETFFNFSCYETGQ